MNTVTILVQSKDDPKNLLSTNEKADAFPEGLTIVFMEAATEAGQIGVELIFKGKDAYNKDTIVGYAVTENNFEAIAGAFIGARMRFNRMPGDQWALVRHYVKDKAKNFLNYLREDKRKLVYNETRKFFGL